MLDWLRVRTLPFRNAQDRAVRLLWIASLLAVPVWTWLTPHGWDSLTVLKAGEMARLGHDPYLADLDHLAQFQKLSTTGSHAGSVPLTFVYPPITLPLLALVAHLPLWCIALCYIAVYFAAILAQCHFGAQALQPDERKYLRYFVPVAGFFPGLLANEAVIGGNVAYILYGAVLCGALAGFRGKGWKWCYVAIVFAACFKPPLLCMTLIPLLSARKQWMAALTTVAAGVTLFALQPFLFPALFGNYVASFQLVFGMNRDFGLSPAGLFACALFDHGRPFNTPAYVLYFAYAIPLLAALILLSRRFLAGAISLQQWVPVLITGVILINPRVMEYDVAPLAIPLAILLWRLVACFASPPRAIFIVASLFLASNVASTLAPFAWKGIAGVLLVVLFMAGCWNMLSESDSFALETETWRLPDSEPEPVMD